MNKNTPILLVEDDPLDVENIKRAFATQGIENTVHVARTGEEALTLLVNLTAEAHTPTPRIILLDLNLPEMGGLEFLEAVRSNPDLRACSVFVMTTSQNERDVVSAYNLNVAGYIVKPLRHGSFTEAIATLNSFWELIELPN